MHASTRQRQAIGRVCARKGERHAIAPWRRTCAGPARHETRAATEDNRCETCPTGEADFGAMLVYT